MYISNLPDELAALVTAELEPGERIAWTGQPIATRFARRSLGIVIFGIPWTAFALFWMAGASGFKLPDFSSGLGLFPLFGLPFVFIGLLMLTSPYWMWRRAHRIAYVVTDKRALVFDGSRRSSTAVRSFSPEKLGDIRRIQHADGTGDLVFERTWSSDGDGGRKSTDQGFHAIQNVRHVESFIRELVSSSVR